MCLKISFNLIFRLTQVPIVFFSVFRIMPSPVNNNEENEPPKTYQPLTLKVDPANIDTPPTNLRTPVKSLSQGYHFNSHQYSHTPTTRPHIGLLSGVVSPQLHTPKSGSVSRTAQLCRQPRSGDSSAKVLMPNIHFQ